MRSPVSEKWVTREFWDRQKVLHRLSQRKRWRANPARGRAARLKRQSANPEKHRLLESIRHKRYWQKHKTRLRAEAREKSRRERVKRMAYQRIWREKNRERENAKARIYNKIRFRELPLFRHCRILRTRLRSFFARSSRARTDASLKAMIGCGEVIFKKHIEKQFLPGMNWDNWTFRGWHMDHIIPLASAKSESEVAILCHYTNLRPMWGIDNIAKGKKLQCA